jgi:hypothetical protein
VAVLVAPPALAEIVTVVDVVTAFVVTGNVAVVLLEGTRRRRCGDSYGFASGCRRPRSRRGRADPGCRCLSPFALRPVLPTRPIGSLTHAGPMLSSPNLSRARRVGVLDEMLRVPARE